MPQNPSQKTQRQFETSSKKFKKSQIQFSKIFKKYVAKGFMQKIFLSCARQPERHLCIIAQKFQTKYC